ncbi:MAG TPA: hypothetical protein VFC78_05265 [Tepidisphaeraceae bacterium]|nr:hypothetical protein [Tepidisphaeraceae bacterium]
MVVLELGLGPRRATDARELFKKLGLEVADLRPIQKSWRAANAAWRRERKRRVAAHAQRVAAELNRNGQGDRWARARGAGMGQARAVWCVELRRKFRTLSEAAAFVNRSPSNILQSLNRGVRCGAYRWEPFDPDRHCGPEEKITTETRRHGGACDS